MERGKTRLLRAAAAAVLAGTGVLGACDGPTEPAESAVAGGPSLLVTPACAGTGGQMHTQEIIDTVQTWNRANSPHRVSGLVQVVAGGRLTILPGVVVCFENYAGIMAWNGGQVVARGRDTAKIVFTARDPAVGWIGLDFRDNGTSSLTNVLVEHVVIGRSAVDASQQHALTVDSAVIRKSGRGIAFLSPNARISRSRVDSTTYRAGAAVMLSNGARFEQTVVRGAAGGGVQVFGTGVVLLGGRIEGSGGIGLEIEGGLARTVRPLRVVGSGSYGAKMTLPTLARLYPTPALQDSLLGNARDIIVVTGGTLREQVTAGPRLPLLITAQVVVDSLGILSAQPGARLVFREAARVSFTNGGRLLARGIPANRVLFTAEDPALGWAGLTFSGPVRRTSYVTNSHLEYANYHSRAVAALDSQTVVVDSSVIRWSGAAALLQSPGSRISRTRVDTTLNGAMAAVDLASSARVEGTLVRAPAGAGLYIRSSAVVVAGCEVRDGDREGILMEVAVMVRACNLVNNYSGGLVNRGSTSADVRYNWWGSVDGPSGPGGNGAFGNVVYTPWRTAPYVLPYVP